MITLTHELILSARTESGGFTGKQLALLNVPWPPKKGWILHLVGNHITEERWERILEARTLYKRGRIDKPEPEPHPYLPGLAG